MAGGRRQNIIARSVTHSIQHSDEKRKSIIKRLQAVFYLYWLNFDCVRQDLFKELRVSWEISDDDYRKSFRANDQDAAGLKPMGNS